MDFIVTAGSRVDWKTERNKIDLAEVIARETNRRAEIRKGRPWFVCPFHEDRRPSLIVRKLDDGRQRWTCYGCGLRGDAASFVMRIRSMTFPEALSHLTGGPAPSGLTRPRPTPEPRPDHLKPNGFSNRAGRGAIPRTFGQKGETEWAEPDPARLKESAALVIEAAARLWTPEGSDALAYLTGPGRCLTPETIRAARLGWTPKAEGVAWKPPGVVIPWFNGGRLALVKVRPPDAWRERFPKERRPPKYLEAFRDPARLVCYPGPEAIRPGRPLVIAEGEFDALCLGEALGELAAVVTLGSASARPEPRALDVMLSAPRWFIATDGDEAGDKAAGGWPARARRVRPPEPYKDWTEAKAGGVNLARWWRDVMTGTERPPLFTWDDLAGWRCGPAIGDPAPGIDVPAGRPLPGLDATRAIMTEPSPDPRKATR